MRKILFLALLSLTSFTLYAQKEINESLSSISAIDVRGAMKVTLVKGSDNNFKASIDGASFDWEVKNGVAMFTLKKPIQIGGEKKEVVANILINYKDVNSISVSNGATVSSKETLKGDVIDLSATAGGVIGLSLNFNDIRVKANTNGVLTLNGESKFLNVKSATNASVNCGDLNVKIADIVSQTNSECYVNAVEKLDARAASNANIFYKVLPENNNITKASLGSVQKY